MSESIRLTMAADDTSDVPAIGTLAAAHAAYLRDRVTSPRFYSVQDIVIVLPLLVAYGLLGGRVPDGLGESDAEQVVLRVGAVLCPATWRDYQANAHVSIGGRLVVGVRGFYTVGPPGTTFAILHPSQYTPRRITRFSVWAVGLLAGHHLSTWTQAALSGDPVAGAALAVVSNSRSSGTSA